MRAAAAEPVEQAAVRQHCKALRLPVVGAQFAPLAEQAQRERQGPVRYLEALLARKHPTNPRLAGMGKACWS